MKSTCRLKKNTYADGSVSLMLQFWCYDADGWADQSETVRHIDGSEDYLRDLDNLRKYILRNTVVKSEEIT